MIDCQGLSVIKSSGAILDNISVKIPQGGVFAVLGRNGAGKSTLLRCLAFAESAYLGKTLISGKDVRSFSADERARMIAWIPERFDVPFPFTVFDLVLMGRYPWHKGHAKAEDRDKTEHALREVGLDGFFRRRVTTLSSGEQRKVVLARALASDAEIVILDEPFANLDIAAADHTIGMIRHLESENKTIISTFHDLSIALTLSQNCVILKNGVAAVSGSTHEVLTAEAIAGTFGVETETLTSSFGSEHIVIKGHGSRGSSER